MAGMPNKLTTPIALAAIAGFEAQKAEIDQKIRELREMLEPAEGRPLNPIETDAPGSAARGKRHFSAAARKRMAEAQQRRWAAKKGIALVAEKPKRKISAAGRRAISAAQKKRWAAMKRAG